MKTIKSMLLASMAMLTCLNFSACSDNNDNPTPGTDDVHFDVWVSVGGSGGMDSEAALVVKNVPSLSDEGIIDFKNQGADVTAKLYQESIIKGRSTIRYPARKTDSANTPSRTAISSPLPSVLLPRTPISTAATRTLSSMATRSSSWRPTATRTT